MSIIRRRVFWCLPLCCLCVTLTGQRREPVFLSYDEARPVLEALAAVLPPDLKSQTERSRRANWTEWVRRSDARTRDRLARGDEDSLVNLLLFGTAFTSQPRITSRQIEQITAGAADPAAAGARLDAITNGRLNDFVAAAASPRANERLAYARKMLVAKGFDLNTNAGQARAKAHLLTELARVLREIGVNQRMIDQSRQAGVPGAEFAERSRIYRTRGLSSDTSLLPNFAVEEALKAMRAKGTLTGTVRKVAVVGPGLDFTDKQEGYDFYPQQTLQPFAIMDSLFRLGLADAQVLQVTTLDVSPRINAHLGTLRSQAAAGQPYVLQLPLASDQRWTGQFVQYWKSFGDQIGEPVEPAVVPPNSGNPAIRAVAVRPGAIARLMPLDVNVVLQRLDLQAEERFDLIVGTNIFVYYDDFQKALAMIGIGKMLRPGGILLSNNALIDLPSSRIRWVGDTTVTYSDQTGNGDTIVWYQAK